jgi:SAM-dependent methyltransferase
MRVCLRCEHAFVSGEWRCPECGFVPERHEGVDAHAPAFAHEGGGFKADYFAELAALEAANFWFKARNGLISWALRRYRPDMGSFLEVGCGTGFVLSGVAAEHGRAALFGSEIFVAGLPYAAARVPTAQFMQMDARRIPFREEFDVVGAFDVLEHIEEDEQVMAQLHQALRSDGMLLATVPQHPWLWSAADDYACHVRRYSYGEIEAKLIRNGFRIERSTSFVSLLLPAMLLSRLQNKKVSEHYDPLAELRLPGALNNLFYGLMRIEQWLIELGINLPVGGSRLIVARKVA